MARPLVLWSKDLGADPRLLSELPGIESVDAGQGWLIFALPLSEAAVHRAEENLGQQLCCLCDELKSEIAQPRAKGVEPAGVEEARWGSIGKIELPGGGRVGLDQPKHPLAIWPIRSDAWPRGDPAV